MLAGYPQAEKNAVSGEPTARKTFVSEDTKHQSPKVDFRRYECSLYIGESQIQGGEMHAGGEQGDITNVWPDHTALRGTGKAAVEKQVSHGAVCETRKDTEYGVCRQALQAVK